MSTGFFFFHVTLFSTQFTLKLILITAAQQKFAANTFRENLYEGCVVSSYGTPPSALSSTIEGVCNGACGLQKKINKKNCTDSAVVRGYSVLTPRVVKECHATLRRGSRYPRS